MSKDRWPNKEGQKRDPSPSAPSAPLEDDPPSCVPSAPPPPTDIPRAFGQDEKWSVECAVCLDPMQRFSDHICPRNIQRLQNERRAPEIEVKHEPFEVKREPSVPVEQHDDCPICLDPIEASSAVMRCKTRPRPHYFHAPCLQAWARAAQANCPMCRNQVEFNVQNLGSYIHEASTSNTLTQGELGFLKNVYKNLENKAHEGWAHCTWDNVQYAGGLLACFSLGFYAGYSDNYMPGIQYAVLDAMPISTHNRIAQNVGWLSGLIFKEFKKRSDKDDDRRR